MNVKKERAPEVCAALRCKDEPSHTVPGLCWDGVPEDERVHLCPRHAEVARVDFGLDEVPGSLRPLRGSIPADEAAELIAQGTKGCGGDACGLPCTRCGSEYGGRCSVPDCDGERRCECPPGNGEDEIVNRAVAANFGEAHKPKEEPKGNALDELPAEALAVVEETTGETPMGVPAAELAQEAEEARGALEAAREMQIETQDDLEFAATVLGETKKKAKELEARLKEITAPLRAAEKSVRDLFRPALDFYGTLEKELKARIGEVKLRQEEENRRAMEAAAAAHAAGDAAGTSQALATVKNLASVKGVGARLAWDFEIEDESQLPRDYLMPNVRAISDAAKGVETPPAIPGVRWFQKPIVSARSS